MLDWTVVAARWGEYASTLLLFGSATFSLRDGAVPGSTRVLLRIFCAIALLSCLGFLMAESVSLGGAARDALDGASLWEIVSTTRFGMLTAGRIVLLLAATLAAFTLAAGRRLALIEGALGGCIVASYAWTGHGTLDEGLPGVAHLGSDVVHLLAAGMWVGALLPLPWTIHRAIVAHSIADVRFAARSLERFSRFGPVVVGLLALTGFANSWFLIGPGRWSTLFTSSYGRVLLLKLALFALMLVLAAINRLRLTPRLWKGIEVEAPIAPVLRALRITVASETLLAGLVLAAVAVLGTLEPPVSIG